MSQETGTTKIKALSLDIVEVDGKWVYAQVSPPVEGPEPVRFLAIGTGAFHNDPEIRDAFLALAKQVCLYAVKGAPGVVGVSVEQEFPRAD